METVIEKDWMTEWAKQVKVPYTGAGRITKDIVLAMQESMKEPDLKLICHMLGHGIVSSANFTKHRRDYDMSAQEIADTWPELMAVRNSNGLLVYPLVPNDRADSLAHSPVKLANIVGFRQPFYNKDAPDDGWNYREGLMMQLRGRQQWEGFFRFIGIKTEGLLPERVELPVHYFKSGHYIIHKFAPRLENFSPKSILWVAKFLTYGKTDTNRAVHDIQYRIQSVHEIAQIAGLLPPDESRCYYGYKSDKPLVR